MKPRLWKLFFSSAANLHARANGPVLEFSQHYIKWHHAAVQVVDLPPEVSPLGAGVAQEAALEGVAGGAAEAGPEEAQEAVPGVGGLGVDMALNSSVVLGLIVPGLRQRKSTKTRPRGHVSSRFLGHVTNSG